MIERSTLLSFTLLNMSFALIPGPDVICIISNSVSRGGRAGAMVCAGIACAALVHVAAASLGLFAFLAAVPTVFAVFKTVGAAYLIWLGWQMLRKPVSLGDQAITNRWSSPFAQGALSNLLNPKIALFFLAILPQFVDASSNRPRLQVATLGIVSIVSAAAVNLCTATLGDRTRRWLVAKPKWFRRLQQFAGAALAGLGFQLALRGVR